MNENKANNWQEKIYAASMVIAPLLLLATSFAEWTGSGPEKDGFGGSLKVLTMFFFIFVILGLTHLLWNRTPRFAVIARFIGVLACVGGAGYGYLGVFYDVQVQAGASEALLALFMSLANGMEGGFTGAPILQYVGILFPLTFIALGIALWRTGAVPAWAGITLALAGLMFPTSRIPDIAMVNYLADLLFVVSLGSIGLSYFSKGRQEVLAAEAV
jgi:hypothetical protein